jgi:hypothetical protein
MSIGSRSDAPDQYYRRCRLYKFLFSRVRTYTHIKFVYITRFYQNRRGFAVPIPTIRHAVVSLTQLLAPNCDPGKRIVAPAVEALPSKSMLRARERAETFFLRRTELKQTAAERSLKNFVDESVRRLSRVLAKLPKESKDLELLLAIEAATLQNYLAVRALRAERARLGKRRLRDRGVECDVHSARASELQERIVSRTLAVNVASTVAVRDASENFVLYRMHKGDTPKCARDFLTFTYFAAPVASESIAATRDALAQHFDVDIIFAEATTQLNERIVNASNAAKESM